MIRSTCPWATEEDKIERQPSPIQSKRFQRRQEMESKNTAIWGNNLNSADPNNSHTGRKFFKKKVFYCIKIIILTFLIVQKHLLILLILIFNFMCCNKIFFSNY